MQIEKLNKWRWILLVTTVVTAVVADAHMNFSDTYVLSTVLGFTSFAAALALGVLILIKSSTLPRQFKVALFVLLGIGIVFWFCGYIRGLNTETWKNLRWTLEEVGLLFVNGFTLLLLLSFFSKTSYIIPFTILAIIIGIILNRLGVGSEAEFLTFMGYLVLASSFLRELVISQLLFKRKLFIKRLLLFLPILLCICTLTIFFQHVSYEPKDVGVYDIIEIFAFLVACMYLFIAMPFSNYVEWTEKLKKHFKRIIILPVIFLFLLLSMKFVLPPETYRKIFFKEHTANKEHFRMDEYKIKTPDNKMEP